MLGLDLPKLYEVAADIQLSQGQFAQAVHLYQLSKCPQLKRVAHFMGYGFLSELIAYIQVLFSTKGVEIVSADKCHFANIALHCFTHQVKDKLQERLAISMAFKRFLKENAYYDEEVAAKLLSEQGLYELLHYFAKVRGQQGLMVETLLSNDIKNAIDSATTNVIHASGYEEIFQHGNDDFYLKCITSYHLLQFLAAKPQLLYLHIQHLITLLPQMDPSLLCRVASLYDPSRQTAKLSFRNMASTKTDGRYWSLTSLTTVASEVLDINCGVENTTGEDVLKFFVFVLLMLCHKLDCPKFDKKLIEYGGINNPRKKAASRQKIVKSSSEFLSLNHSSVSCGQAHSAYVHNGILYTWGKTGSGRLGTEDVGAEYQVPQPVPALLRLQVTVLTVSCGALHTLALTDYGLLSWGSSRFGQLGVGDVQQAIQPLIIESLQSETIIKIECGQYHSLALTAEGRVFSWGWGIHGQLGHGNAENLNLPKIIRSLKKVVIVSICAGQGHSALLSQNDEVYTFGCGMFGQLGTGFVSKHSYPQLVNIPERIKLIASGHFHVLAVSRTNRMYTWGCNPQALRLQAQNSRRARHQGNILYQNSRSSNYVASTIMNNSALRRSGDVNETLQQSHLLPSLVNTTSVTDTIIQLSCGSHHSVLITTCGDIYSWGRNSEGQIGNGTRREQKIPTLISSLKEKKIVHSACGADFTIAVDSDGRIWGWGQNDSGQIGQKPLMDTNAKSTSTTSGRVITIRTNRRMITITQPCRQSILRPAEIVIPSYELKVKDLDSGSFENEYSVLKLVNHKGSAASLMNDIPDLSKLDKPPYGPFTLHTALKVFHRFCDSCTLLNHCLKFGNFQAAATLCVLENLYDKALEYQLKALISFSDSNKTRLDMAMYVLGCYVRLIDRTNIAT
ncbi:X-linked retinitis pigmentosa GTPase regulator-like protein, partial [Stegodyphus mimosarum]